MPTPGHIGSISRISLRWLIARCHGEKSSHLPNSESSTEPLDWLDGFGSEEWRKSGWDTEQIEDAFKTLAWLGFMRESGGRYEVAEDAESFLQGIGFYFHEVLLPARGERFNTNCAPDFFIMTYRPARERMLERVSEVARSTAAEGMSEKMLDAIRGVNTSGARALKDSAFYGDERAILNDACGWSDQPIRVVMDHGKLVEIAPDTTWYLLGGG